MKNIITEDEIFEIETEKQVGEFVVKRVNMSEVEVIQNGIVVFKGEDYEVAEYINSVSA